MARIGQKFNKYTKEIKKEVVEEYYKNKKSLKEIADIYNIKSFDTILSWVKHYTQEGDNAFLEKRGKATKKTSPLKGRPKKRFVSLEDKKQYFEYRKTVERMKVLENEENKRKSKKL